MKCGKIYVKNTEKPTFLILKDDSILRTALSESPITSLKFEHLSNQRTETTHDALIGARYMPQCCDLIGARYIP